MYVENKTKHAFLLEKKMETHVLSSNIEYFTFSSAKYLL